MISLKTLVFLVVITTVSCGQIVDFTLNNLVDQSVEPCENFYRHACSRNTKYGLFDYASDLYKKEINIQLNSTDSVSSFLNDLLQCQKTNYVEGTVSGQLKTQFKAACKRGEEKKFIKELGKLIRLPSATCKNPTELYATFDELDETFAENYANTCESMVSSTKERLWLHQNKNLLDNLRKMFDDLKSIYGKWIQETPYIINHNATKQYLELLDLLGFDDQSESQYIGVLTEKYGECKETIAPLFKNTTASNIFCLLTTAQQLYKRTDPVPVEYNAYNGGGSIYFGLPMLTMAKHVDIRSFLIGQIGYIIGHEIGHSIIQSKRDIPHPFFSNRTANCIQNQFLKTCNFYPEYKCQTLETRLDDNGADLLGARGSLYIAIQEFGSEFYQTSAKYSNLTNAKLFFYGFASPLCNFLGFNEQHPGGVIRYNAMAAQNPEFQETFRCNSHSKIAKSLHKKCFIVGEESSPQIFLGSFW